MNALAMMNETATEQRIFSRRKAGQTTSGRSPGKPVVLDRDSLSKYFNVSLQQACEELGIGRSTMKRLCRKFGIKSWPRQSHESYESSRTPSPQNAAPAPVHSHAVANEEPASQPPLSNSSDVVLELSQHLKRQDSGEIFDLICSDVHFGVEQPAQRPELVQEPSKPKKEQPAFDFAIPQVIPGLEVELPDFAMNLNTTVAAGVTAQEHNCKGGCDICSRDDAYSFDPFFGETLPSCAFDEFGRAPSSFGRVASFGRAPSFGRTFSFGRTGSAMPSSFCF